jgi:hypothetical protein
MCSEDDQPPQVVTFIGYEGFCALCVDKYKVCHSIQTIVCLKLTVICRSCRLPSLLEATRTESSTTGSNPVPSIRTVSHHIFWPEVSGLESLVFLASLISSRIHKLTKAPISCFQKSWSS